MLWELISFVKIIVKRKCIILTSSDLITVLHVKFSLACCTLFLNVPLLNPLLLEVQMVVFMSGNTIFDCGLTTQAPWCDELWRDQGNIFHPGGCGEHVSEKYASPFSHFSYFALLGRRFLSIPLQRTTEKVGMINKIVTLSALEEDWREKHFLLLN